ncbi:hypothetical protein AAC387_Pa09g2398 [Persea americana]
MATLSPGAGTPHLGSHTILTFIWGRCPHQYKGGDNTNEGNIVVQKSKGGVFFEKGGEVLSIGAEVGGVKAATKV